MCPFQGAPDVIVLPEDIILSPPQITSPGITYAGSSFRVLLAGGPATFTLNSAYIVRATLAGGGTLQGNDVSAGLDGVYQVSGNGGSTLTWTLYTGATATTFAQQLSQVSTKFPFSIIKNTDAGRVGGWVVEGQWVGRRFEGRHG